MIPTDITDLSILRIDRSLSLILVVLFVHPASGFYEVEPHAYTTRNDFTYRTCPENYCGAGGNCRPKSNILEYIPCYCDIYCELLNDCCLDHMKCTQGIDLVLLLADDIINFRDFYGCAEVGYMAVTKCPKSVTGYLKSACEDEQPCDIFKRAPAVANGVIFKNLYCAQCHDFGLNNVTLWRIQISEESVVDVSASSVFRMIFGNMNHNTIRHGMCTKFKARPSEPKTYFLRECQYYAYRFNDVDKVNESEIVSKCDPNLRIHLKDFSILDHECLIYNANVFGRIPRMSETVRFKNMFCAKCNGVKESDIVCPEPRRVHHPPKFESDLSPSREFDHYATLDSLMNSAETIPCENGKLFDGNTKTCRVLPRCDVSHVQWEGKCIRDPFDQAHTPPVLGQGAGNVHLDITILPKFMTVLTDLELESNDTWSTSILPAIVEYLYIENFDYYVKFINEIDVTFDSSLAEETVELLDGKELHFDSNTTFHAYIVHNEMSYEQVQELAHHMKFFNNRQHQVKVEYMVFSKDVVSPMRCEEGELVYIRNTTESRRYFNTMRGGLDLNNLTWMRNDTDMYIVACDKYSKMFSTCSRLTNQSLDRFDSDSGELRLKGSEETVENHVIIGNFVFGCHKEEIQKEHLARTVLTVIGMSLSLLCLAFTLLTYCAFSDLRTMPGLLLMNLCITLIVSQLLFLSAIDKTSNPQTCEIIAIVLHFFWLSTFFWMSTIAFNMMWTFTTKLNPIQNAPNYKSLVLYTLFAYGVPACVVTVSIIFDKSEIFSVGYQPPMMGSAIPNCWLGERNGIIYTFIIPVGLLITANIVLFTITSFSIFWTRKLSQQAKRDPKNRREFMLYIKLFFLMGLTWVIRFVCIFHGHVIVWCLFDLFNSLVGVYIGLSFAMNKRVLHMWRPRGGEPGTGNGQAIASERPPSAYSAISERDFSPTMSKSSPLTTVSVDGCLHNGYIQQYGSKSPSDSVVTA